MKPQLSIHGYSLLLPTLQNPGQLLSLPESSLGPSPSLCSQLELFKIAEDILGKKRWRQVDSYSGLGLAGIQLLLDQNPDPQLALKLKGKRLGVIVVSQAHYQQKASEFMQQYWKEGLETSRPKMFIHSSPNIPPFFVLSQFQWSGLALSYFGGLGSVWGAVSTCRNLLISKRVDYCLLSIIDFHGLLCEHGKREYPLHGSASILLSLASEQSPIPHSLRDLVIRYQRANPNQWPLDSADLAYCWDAVMGDSKDQFGSLHSAQYHHGNLDAFEDTVKAKLGLTQTFESSYYLRKILGESSLIPILQFQMALELLKQDGSKSHLISGLAPGGLSAAATIGSSA